MEEFSRPKLMRRKGAQSVVFQPCQKCAAQMNLRFFFISPKKYGMAHVKPAGKKQRGPIPSPERDR